MTKDVVCHSEPSEEPHLKNSGEALASPAILFYALARLFGDSTSGLFSCIAFVFLREFISNRIRNPKATSTSTRTSILLTSIK